MSLTELLDWLEESTGCTPQQVDMDFWEDVGTRAKFLQDLSDRIQKKVPGSYNFQYGPLAILQKKGTVLYTAKDEIIKGIFIVVESWDNEAFAYLIQETRDCLYLAIRVSKRLTSLPDSIGQLTTLTSLDVSSTQISKLPESISRLTNLTSLNLIGMHLSELPESIGQLTKLTSLNISSTQISKLPESIGQLTNLTSLVIGFTRINKLPESINRLTNLTSLNLSGMHFSKLPVSISRLTNLTSLNLSYLHLSELPESIGQLTNLTSLSIHTTQISNLPEFIGQLTNLTSLDISGTKISELPESISQLTNLTSLDIGNTKISELPESISQLTNLTSLDIGGTLINKLPEFIGQLTKLTSLDIHTTQISELPEFISQLTNLTSLDISYTQISELPESIGQLTNLTSLSMRYTQINELPESIGQLTNLTSLSIGYTQINELPESIGQLTNLDEIYINDTQISELPESIGQLTNLDILNISRTQISELPESLFALPLRRLNLSGLTLSTLPSSILHLNLPFSFSDEYGEQISLSGTDILETGTSIFKRSMEDIRLYYDELEREKVLLNETRVIFIGDGDAGKSTIIYRLMTGEYKEGLKETKGILMNKWNPDSDPQTSLLTFWDFGGQAVMHSMHEFFLGNRCLYVLVLDGRREDSPEYWLDLIRQYGRKSTVLVVMNKIDEPGYAKIDETKLRREYGGLFNSLSFYQLSCKTGNGFDAFQADLIEKTKESESYRKVFPGRWYRIKEKLSDLTDEDGNPTNYLREDVYLNYCTDEGIVDSSPREALLGWLNDLGVCFSYRSKEASGAVEEFKVLRPEWITNGIYKIINSSEARQCNGFIPHDTIKDVLDKGDDVNPRYRNTERDFILGMMREIGLSYPEGRTEFIPMLTPDNEPALPPLDNPIHIQLQYTAPLPIYVLYHLVVRLREDVDRSNTWKHGTYLTNREDCRAIIRFGKTKDILDIFASGNKKEAYLAYIRQNLAYVQKDLTIEFKEYIEYTEYGKTALLDLELMLTMLRHRKDTVFVLEIERDINLVTVLRSIAPDEVIQVLLAKIREYEDDKNRYRQGPANYTELRNILYSIGITTEMIDERLRAMSDKEDKILATVGESSIKTDQILTNTNEILAITQSLRKAIQELQEFSDEQIVGIQSIFEALRGNEFEEGIADQIKAVLAEVKRGNTKTLGEKLILFLGAVGSVASITDHSRLPSYLKMLQAALQALLKFFGLG